MLSVGYLAGVGPINDKSQRVFVSGNFNSGNSGGPVIDVNSGLVVGVVSAKAGGLPPILKAAVEALHKLPSDRKLKLSIDGKDVEVPEADVLLELVRHFDGNVQLGIGVMVLPGDLRAFVARQGVTP